MHGPRSTQVVSRWILASLAVVMAGAFALAMARLRTTPEKPSSTADAAPGDAAGSPSATGRPGPAAVGRYATRLDLSEPSHPKLTQMVPSTGGGRALALVTPPTSLGAILAQRRAAPETTVVVLTQIARDGTIASAEPVGALMIERPVAAAIIDLVKRSHIEPYEADEPIWIALRIAIPAGGQ